MWTLECRRGHSGGMTPRLARFTILGMMVGLLVSRDAIAAGPAPLRRIPGTGPRNVVFILADDHRYDAMGFMGHPWLKTPNLDELARNGAHLQNAFVTTSLCSPSRASILTGLYTHRHQVVDNYHAVKAGTVLFPQYLQTAGYQTAFLGKWHMGNTGDAPQPGFDHWVSFEGQGEYLPEGQQLNVDGRKVPRKTYITDELTDRALDWMKQRNRKRPFFLYLSHKGVHSDFTPAERHRGLYAGKPLPEVPVASLSGLPRWVQDQRNSWHGVTYPYHSRLDLADYHQRYGETLMSVDESLGRVMAYLKQEGLFESTLVIYMGDNGFAFGEHGLIDKRTAYEESMRVPMLAHCPQMIAAGTKVTQVTANIDVAPTVLSAAGLIPPKGFDGANLLPLLAGKEVPWRKAFLYQYYWERNFPQTPTLFAVRGERYKYIRQQGLWDIDELYDLQQDPHETKNLIFAPEYQQIVIDMNGRLWSMLESAGAMAIPLQRDVGKAHNHRLQAGPAAGNFAPQLVDAHPEH
jgi:N-acetylglucosamine-6-sulfatase